MTTTKTLIPARKWRVLRHPAIRSVVLGSGLLLLLHPTCRPAQAAGHLQPGQTPAPRVMLLTLGDSLTHGTMDGINNTTNTLHAYVQRVADSLAQVTPLIFSQPLFDDQENRLQPFRVPTNLGVDGADIFSAEGLEYYKRVGADESYITASHLCDQLLPRQFADKYDKVLYPLNLLARQPVSQIDAAIERLTRFNPGQEGRAAVIFWLGNNDSSLAALGMGGANPMFMPIPYNQIKAELLPGLALLLGLGESQGEISFAPYSQPAIERNLTNLEDFVAQYNQVLGRLMSEADASQLEIFLLTLPYYSAVGYLLDSDDLEYYLKKVNPAYTVPPTFARVAPAGEPITDPLKGDRVSFFTFGFMYALLATGYPVEYANQVLEQDGLQVDGLVLSEAEQQLIMARIDGFNQAIKNTAAALGPRAHLVDIGQYLNDVLSGKTPVIINGRIFTRKWVRGSTFTMDGVHPDYTGQALVANMVLAEINSALNLAAPAYDLAAVMATDVYIDQDGDGWAPGPQYEATGIPELLYLFKDADDANPAVGVTLPPDVWTMISQVLLREILGIPSLKAQAEHMGLIPAGAVGR